MRFLATSLGALVLLAPFAVHAESAEVMGTPLAADLSRVPIGTWAEYALKAGSRSGKVRWSVIGRDARSVTLEMRVEGSVSPTTLRLQLVPNPTATDKPVQKVVVQVGDEDPVELSSDVPQMRERFRRPDPSHRVATEAVTVPGGEFQTTRYRWETSGGRFEVWIDERVLPLGLVKMVFEPKPARGKPASASTVMTELVARGGDAKPLLVKTAISWSAALRRPELSPAATAPTNKTPSSTPAIRVLRPIPATGVPAKELER